MYVLCAFVCVLCSYNASSHSPDYTSGLCLHPPLPFFTTLTQTRSVLFFPLPYCISLSVLYHCAATVALPQFSLSLSPCHLSVHPSLKSLLCNLSPTHFLSCPALCRNQTDAKV